MINLCSKFCTFVVVLLFNINPTVFRITTFSPFPSILHTIIGSVIQQHGMMGKECAQYDLEWIHIFDKLPQDKSKRFVTSVRSIWQHNN